MPTHSASVTKENLREFAEYFFPECHSTEVKKNHNCKIRNCQHGSFFCPSQVPDFGSDGEALVEYLKGMFTREGLEGRMAEACANCERKSELKSN